MSTTSKTADIKPFLLKKGDRIAGKSARGTEYTGTFEGCTTDSKEWVRCNTGEKTIALDPLSVSRVPVEPAGNGKDPTRLQPALFELAPPTLDEEITKLYAELQETEATAINAGKAALSLYLSIGGKLLNVKESLEHGQWLPWLQERGIQERKAQRAIQLFSKREALGEADSLTDLTLTEALERISKKTLKPAQPDQESGVRSQESALTPESIEAQFAFTGDHATPSWEQLQTLYSQLGVVRCWKKGFAVEREDMGAPFPLCFPNRATAWKRWQMEWRSFAASHPLPVTITLADDVSVAAEKTEGLKDENRASVVDEYEYVDIASHDAWFDTGDGIAAGTAIAANGKGMVRINWGRGKQSDVPRDRVYLSDPAITAVTPEVEAGLAAMGIEVCAPSITPEEFNREMWGEAKPTLRPVQPNGLVEERPACSRWEPEEVQHVARIQIEGLLKHLEPAELVKAAIVHSGVSLVDAVRVAVEMADYNTDGIQIYEVVTTHPNCLPF